MDSENENNKRDRLINLANDLREYAEWADANIYEVPITLPDVLNTAAEIIETEVIGRICQDAHTP